MLLLIGLLLGGGIAIVGKSHQEKTAKPTSSPEKQAAPTKTIQMQTAEKFFQSYNACWEQPPPEAGDKPNIYCATHIQLATDKLETYIAKQPHPVTCSTSVAKSAVAIRSTNINENQALVVLSEDFGKSKINVTYQLQREDGEWKVENILCPK